MEYYDFHIIYNNFISRHIYIYIYIKLIYIYKILFVIRNHFQFKPIGL